MSNNFKYTTIDRVLSKFHRDLRGTTINEGDAIEWIGEAMEYLKIPSMQEEAVAFLEVTDHQVDVPDGLTHILQISKKRHWTKETCTPGNIVKESCGCGCNTPSPSPCNCSSTSVNPVSCNCNPNKERPCGSPLILTDCMGRIINWDIDELGYYRPRFDLQWEFQPWDTCRFHRLEWENVKLASNTMFPSVLCKEGDDTPYRTGSGCGTFRNNCNGGNHWEYSVVGTYHKCLRFNFNEGYIALAYLRSAIDKETGYPLIPEVQQLITAITYYIEWKIAEWYNWNGREGYQNIVQDKERLWLKYARQAINYMKMPKSLDEYQNLLEQSVRLLPDMYKYNRYFGNRQNRQRGFNHYNEVF